MNKRRFGSVSISCLVMLMLCQPYPISAVAGESSGGGGWYSVRPQPDDDMTVARFHSWHEVVAEPEGPGRTLPVVRDAMTAERISRFTGVLDSRAPDNAAALQWMAAQAAADAERERGMRTDTRGAERQEGGLLDGWLSRHVALQEERRYRTGWDSVGRAGALNDTGASGWGWLADEVKQREAAERERTQRLREQARSQPPGGAYGGYGDTGVLPGWQTQGAGRTPGIRPARH